MGKVRKNWGKLGKIGKNGKNLGKYGKIGKNWKKWEKWEKIGKIGKNWKKWEKLEKIEKNIFPFFPWFTSKKSRRPLDFHFRTNNCTGIESGFMGQHSTVDSAVEFAPDFIYNLINDSKLNTGQQKLDDGRECQRQLRLVRKRFQTN
jgi:hypothetical protein